MAQTTLLKVEIEICSDCNGFGNVDNPRYFHGDEEAPEKIPCGNCKGHGRLMKRTKIEYYRLNDETFAKEKN